MLEIFTGLGEIVVEFVIWISSLLRERHMPGIVSFGLVAILVGVSGSFWIKKRRRITAIDALKSILVSASDEPTRFAVALNNVNQKIKALEEGKHASTPRKAVVEAWGEYRETFVKRFDGDQPIQCNTVRPSQFFNLDDLHFGAGFYRFWPGLFVTAGLFLTFLGLVSALHAMNTAEGVSEEAMVNLLAVASAKFIMSLTGLLCSIVFTVVFRLGTGRVERAIHSLNREIEKCLEFISLERLAVDQLKATQEQRDHFREIGMELVEELGRPLREELPKTIGESIGNAVAPLIEQVGELGTSNVGNMVRDLSSRLSADIESALLAASKQLSEAGNRLSELVNRMAGNSNQMSAEMTNASGRLLDVVEKLHDATDESIKIAQVRMDQSGESAAKDISGAGERVKNAIDDTSREIAEIIGEVTEKAGKDLIYPIDQITAQMLTMVTTLKEGVIEMSKVADGARESADASKDASSNFRQSATILVDASNEIKPTVDHIETSLNNLTSATRLISDSASSSTTVVERALEAAKETLGGERRAVELTLRGLESLLEQTKGQGDRMDEIDGKLGRAFEKYRTQVETTVGSLYDHVQKMNESLRPAVDTLREVVDQAQAFKPESNSSWAR